MDLDGVILLEVCDTLTKEGKRLLVVSALLVIAIICFLMLLCLLITKVYGKKASCLSFGISGILIVLVMWADTKYLDPSIRSKFSEYGTVYKVTITDNVDTKEFQKRFEIIDYEDGVYTVRVKEEDDVKSTAPETECTTSDYFNSYGANRTETEGM